MCTTLNHPKGRFAPTPSGRMHLGNAFSCLMAWLSAKSCGGTMVLRIEDLDPRARDRKLADILMQDLEWLGLDWDEGPFYQSDRLDIYSDAVRVLTDRGLTYPCFCTRAELHASTAPHASDGTYLYQGTCKHLTKDQLAEKSARRPPATRLSVPAPTEPLGTISFTDMCYGPQTEVLATECGDFLIRRSDGVFAYQLAVAVDDGLMGVTEVVRGRDLLGSSARQIYIASLLGLPTMTYGHVPLLLSSDGRRLSKRDQDLDLAALRDAGTDPASLVGKLASLVGLVPAGEKVMPRDLLDVFSWDTIRAHSDDIAVK